MKDKIAASRRKGKWPGGTVPFGYDAKDKKLAMNKVEAETVRAIFRLYLEHKSFGILVGELDRRKMVTKRRNVSNPKCKGGIPFIYGPLAYFLENRIYVGEVRYGEKWFKGEHAAILNRQTFERVQDLLKSNRVIRRIKHSESGALLQDKLFDDKGNRMGPSFSSKNGVRYRFYVSTALRGRKQQAGTITQDSAPEIERIVEEALHREINEQGAPATTVWDIVDRVVVRLKSIVVTLRSNTDERPVETIEIPWASKTPDRCNTPISSSNCAPIESWSKLLFARTLGCPS